MNTVKARWKSSWWWRFISNQEKLRTSWVPPFIHTTAESASAKGSQAKSNNEEEQPRLGAAVLPPPNVSSAESPNTKETLLKAVLSHAHLQDSEYYKMGYANGLDMGYFKDALAGIEAYFDALIASGEQTKQIFGGEIVVASKELEDLEKEIIQLEEDLDEHNEHSTAWQICNEIKLIREKVDVHLQSKFKDDFVRKHKAIIESYHEEERAQIEALRGERERHKVGLVDLIEQAKQRMLDLLKNEVQFRIKKKGTKKKSSNVEEEEEENNIVENIQQISEAYSETAIALNDLSDNIFGAMHEKHELLFERLAKEEEAIKKEPLQVPRRPRLWSLLMAFFVIIMGELYILSHLTTKVLEMDPGLITNLFGGGSFLTISFFRFAVLAFFIAYPTALGMITKFYISHHKRDRSTAINNLILWVGIIAIAMIASIAILNPGFLQNPPVILSSTAKWIGYSIIFFGITSIFSVVAGILYVEFMEGYELFRNARKESLFGVKDQDSFVAQYEQQVQKKRLELERLQEQLITKKRRKYELQDIVNIDLVQWNVLETLGHLKRAACSAYKYGYQRGLDQALKNNEHDPEQLLKILTARRITKHHLKLFEDKP